MKWLVKAVFLASTVMVVPIALSAQNTAPDLLGIGEKLGTQGQKITTLEQTAQDTKKEIHEFKQDVDARFDKVDKRFDRLEQLIANSTAETNARFEKMSAETNARFEKMSAETNARFERYFNQMDARLNQTDAYLKSVETRMDTRLKAVEQPWGTNILSNVITDPLMVATSAMVYLGTTLAHDYPHASYSALGLSTAFFAQVLWNAFAPPVQYAIASGCTFVVAAAGSIYALHQNQAAVGSTVKAVSGLAGLVSVGGVIIKAVDTAGKKKQDL